MRPMAEASQGPTQLASGQDGSLIVSSTASGDVLGFVRQSGTFDRTLAHSGDGTLRNPKGLAIGPDGNLYVGSAANERILRFDGTGEFIDIFATAAGGLSGLDLLVFGPDGNLYVSGSNSQTVAKYDGSSGAFLGTFIEAGSGGLGQILSMAFSPNGQLFVGSTGSGEKILRFDGASGAFLNEAVAAGTGGLVQPSGIVFDANQNLIVSSAGTNEVLKFSSINGSFLGTSGCRRPGIVAAQRSPPRSQQSNLFTDFGTQYQSELDIWSDNQFADFRKRDSQLERYLHRSRFLQRAHHRRQLGQWHHVDNPARGSP